MVYNDKVIGVGNRTMSQENGQKNVEENRRNPPLLFPPTLPPPDAPSSRRSFLPTLLPPAPFVLLMLRVLDGETHAPSAPHSCTRVRWRWEGVAAGESRAAAACERDAGTLVEGQHGRQSRGDRSRRRHRRPQ